jgi:hypothetical protein
VERELAGMSRSASVMVNQAVGQVPNLVSVYLTRRLSLRPPTEGAALVGVTASLADQLREKLRGSLTDTCEMDTRTLREVLGGCRRCQRDQMAAALL